jgi:hypothetical protein
MEPVVPCASPGTHVDNALRTVLTVRIMGPSLKERLQSSTLGVISRTPEELTGDNTLPLSLSL